MNRTLLIVGGLALLGAGYVGNQLLAQAPAPIAPTVAAPPAHTRVAFVNIEVVFQKYEKAKLYKIEMEKALEPFRVKAETLKNEMIKWEQDMRDPKFDISKKEQYEQGILKNKRDLEDLERQARKMVGKKNEEQVVQLYKEVNEAVQGYAQSNGLQAVLSYGDSPQIPSLSYVNIARRVQGMEQTGCAAVMYMAPGLDISEAIVASLNSRYGRAATGTPAPTGGIQPTGGSR